jgi:hypothetical protein
MKALASILSVALLTGCASTPPSPGPLPTLPRVPPPAEALQPSPGPCLLPAWYDRATPEDQAALDLNCAIVNGLRTRELQRKWSALVEWADRVGP